MGRGLPALGKQSCTCSRLCTSPRRVNDPCRPIESVHADRLERFVSFAPRIPPDRKDESGGRVAGGAGRSLAHPQVRRAVHASWAVFSQMLVLYIFVIGVLFLSATVRMDVFTSFGMFWAPVGHVAPHAGAAL